MGSLTGVGSQIARGTAIARSEEFDRKRNEEALAKKTAIEEESRLKILRKQQEFQQEQARKQREAAATNVEMQLKAQQENAKKSAGMQNGRAIFQSGINLLKAARNPVTGEIDQAQKAEALALISKGAEIMGVVDPAPDLDRKITESKPELEDKNAPEEAASLWDIITKEDPLKIPFEAPKDYEQTPEDLFSPYGVYSEVDYTPPKIPSEDEKYRQSNPALSPNLGLVRPRRGIQ